MPHFEEPAVQASQPAEQEHTAMHRAMLTKELAAAFSGSALATVGIEHNVRGFVAAAALGTVALILARSANDAMRADRVNEPSEDHS